MNTITIDALQEAISKIIEDPSKIIEIGKFTESNQIPDFKIRYMKTVGGVQLCLKEVSFRGEGSGMYYPKEEQNRIIECLLATITRRNEFAVKLSSKFNTPIIPYSIRISPDTIQTSMLSMTHDGGEIFPGEKTITLSL